MNFVQGGVPIGVDRTWVKYIEKGEFPNTRRMFTVMRCNHCDWAPCTTICPILDSILVGLQDKLTGGRRSVRLVTVSIDPLTDTPARLRQHARKLGARPDWTFITGKKPNIDRILTGLGMYSPDIMSHSPAIVVGDPTTGTWKKLYGFPSKDKVLAAVTAFADPSADFGLRFDATPAEAAAPEPAPAPEKPSPEQTLPGGVIRFDPSRRR